MKTLFIDTETEGLNPYKDKLICIGYALDNENPKISYLFNLDEIKTLFNSNCLKVFHNANFDLLFLNKNGIPTKGPYFDTQIVYKILNPYESSKLKDLGYKYGFTKKPMFLEKIVEIKEKSSFIKIGCNNSKGYGWIDPQVLSDYLTQDVNLTRQLYYKVLEIGVPSCCLELEFNLIQPILDMELRGLKIDKDHANNLLSALNFERKKLDKYFESLKINPRSYKQISKYLENENR